MSRASLLWLALLSVACDSPAEPKKQPTAPAEAIEAPPVAAQPEPTPEPTPKSQPELAPTPDGWQRGTITAFPDTMYGVHADDDSVTLCAPDLAPELQKDDLAVLFRGDPEPPIPRDRRWCRISTNLEIKLPE